MNQKDCSSENLLNLVKDLCAFYGKNPFKIGCENNGRIPVVQFDSSSEAFRGMRNIIDELDLQNSRCSTEIYAIADWSDYCLSKVLNKSVNFDIEVLLKDLNRKLRYRVYLVGVSTTAADVLLYYSTYNIMLALSLKDKEKYCNVSRWFDHIQHNEKLRSHRQVIPFSKVRLFA